MTDDDAGPVAWRVREDDSARWTVPYDPTGPRESGYEVEPLYAESDLRALVEGWREGNAEMEDSLADERARISRLKAADELAALLEGEDTGPDDDLETALDGLVALSRYAEERGLTELSVVAGRLYQRVGEVSPDEDWQRVNSPGPLLEGDDGSE